MAFLLLGERRNIYVPQSWSDHCSRRATVARSRLSRARSRNAQTRLPQSNNLWLAKAYLTRRLHERDLSRGVEGLQVTVDKFLDHWLRTAVRPKVRAKTYSDYAAMLRRYIRSAIGARILARSRLLKSRPQCVPVNTSGSSGRTLTGSAELSA
jgi:hypothetical protein